MSKPVDLPRLESLIEIWNQSKGTQADELREQIFPQIQAVRRTGQCTRKFSMIRQAIAQLDFARISAT